MCGRCWGPKIEIVGNKIDEKYADWLTIWKQLTEVQGKETVKCGPRRERLRAKLRAKIDVNRR